MNGERRRSVSGAAFLAASDSAAVSALTEGLANSASLWAATVHSIATLEAATAAIWLQW